MATKKVTFKNEVNNILNNMQEMERPSHLSECPKEYKYQEGNFKCYVDTSVMSLEDAKKMIADNADRLNRNLRHFHASELNRRSNFTQNALAYIGQHRELIPFLDYVTAKVEGGADVDKAAREYGKQHPDMPKAVKDYAHDKSTFAMWYINGKGTPPLQVILKELPYIPKAWRA